MRDRWDRIDDAGISGAWRIAFAAKTGARSLSPSDRFLAGLRRL
jgi:hypothetical protein